MGIQSAQLSIFEFGARRTRRSRLRHPPVELPIPLLLRHLQSQLRTCLEKVQRHVCSTAFRNLGEHTASKVHSAPQFPFQSLNVHSSPRVALLHHSTCGVRDHFSSLTNADVGPPSPLQGSCGPVDGCKEASQLGMRRKEERR